MCRDKGKHHIIQNNPRTNLEVRTYIYWWLLTLTFRPKKASNVYLMHLVMVCKMCLPDRVQSAVVQTPSTKYQDTQEVTVPEGRWFNV